MYTTHDTTASMTCTYEHWLHFQAELMEAASLAKTFDMMFRLPEMGSRLIIGSIAEVVTFAYVDRPLTAAVRQLSWSIAYFEDDEDILEALGESWDDHVDAAGVLDTGTGLATKIALVYRNFAQLYRCAGGPCSTCSAGCNTPIR